MIGLPVLRTHVFYNIEISKSNSITFFQNPFVNELTSIVISKMMIKYCSVINVFKPLSPQSSQDGVFRLTKSTLIIT